MSNPDEPDNTFSDRLNPPAPSFHNSLSETATEEVTVIVIVMLSVFFVITFIIYFRSRHHSDSNAGGGTRPRRRTLVFAPGRPAGFLHRPLDPSILEYLPVTVIRREDQEGGLDCAVCLSELLEGEEARLLPKCSHGFHVECIDMWFRSNSTCPLCRLPVGSTPSSLEPLPRAPAVRKDTRPIESTASFDEGSSSTPIEVPIPTRGGAEGLESPPPAQRALERSGHVRRILSSRGSCDIEQGFGVEKASLLAADSNSNSSTTS